MTNPLVKSWATTSPEQTAVASSVKATHLSWLINNPQFGASSGLDNPKQVSNIDFDVADENGASFTEFSLHMDDAVAS